MRIHTEHPSALGTPVSTQQWSALQDRAIPKSSGLGSPQRSQKGPPDPSSQMWQRGAWLGPRLRLEELEQELFAPCPALQHEQQH